MKTICLDVDGVCANFIDGACRLFGHDPAAIRARWEPGEWNFFKYMTLTATDFYGGIAAAGEGFWAGLEPYPHARELIELCSVRAELFFATTPTRDAGSIGGKYRWLCQHAPKLSTRAVFSEHKHLLAMPGRLLIDDSDFNCAEFRRHGGDALLFPAMQNARHAEADRAFAVAKKEIVEWLAA